MEFYRSLVEHFKLGGLIWLRDWPMSQDYQMAMIKRLRGSFGETAELIDVPGQYIDRNEQDLFIQFLTLLTGFWWDANSISKGGEIVVSTWHHKLIRLQTPKPEIHDELKRMIANHDLKIEMAG
jgi:hypothetical protein